VTIDGEIRSQTAPYSSTRAGVIVGYTFHAMFSIDLADSARILLIWSAPSARADRG